MYSRQVWSAQGYPSKEGGHSEILYQNTKYEEEKYIISPELTGSF